MYKSDCLRCSKSVQVSEFIGKNPSWFEVFCEPCEVALGL